MIERLELGIFDLHIRLNVAHKVIRIDVHRRVIDSPNGQVQTVGMTPSVDQQGRDHLKQSRNEC